MDEPRRQFPHSPKRDCDGDIEREAAPAGPSATGEVAQVAALPMHSDESPIGHSPLVGYGNEIVSNDCGVRNRRVGGGFGSTRVLRIMETEVAENQQYRKRVPR